MGRFEIALLAGLLIALLTGPLSTFAGDCGQVRGEVLRLHILANSDSEEDQALKLQVRDALLAETGELFAEAGDLAAATAAAQEALPQLEEAARQVMAQSGYPYDAHAQLVTMFFETRQYDGFTLPAGTYQAVRITLGQGGGHNWWCVMYPPLCIPAAAPDDSTEARDIVELGTQPGYQMGFALVEAWEELCNRLAPQPVPTYSDGSESAESSSSSDSSSQEVAS